MNRPLAEPAAEEGIGGDSERRTGVYTRVHEDSSTESTNKSPSAVGLCKKSNKITVAEYLLNRLKEMSIHSIFGVPKQ